MAQTHKTTRVVPAGKSTGALLEALQAAIGVKSTGYKTGLDGRIVLILTDDTTPDELNTAAQIVETWNFDTLTADEQTALRKTATAARAATNAANIPSWASFTEAEALAWLDSHVSATQVNAIANLADAKVVLSDMATLLRALVRLAVALRDDTWPGLSN